MEIVKQNDRAHVTLSRDENNRYRVTAGDEVLVETRVETLARLTYEDAVAERDPAIKLREKEAAFKSFEAARWEGFGVRSTKNRRGGGKGGRGGV